MPSTDRMSWLDSVITKLKMVSFSAVLENTTQQHCVVLRQVFSTPNCSCQAVIASRAQGR